jgi:O-antigen/teichoic acid export membrane protein
MQTKFVLNLAILLFLNLLVKPFWIFGIDRNVQNLAGAEEYGIYFALFNFSLVFSILLDLGITNYNTRNIAQNNHLVEKYFSKLVVLKLILGLFYFAVVGVLFFVFNYPIERLEIFGLLALNQFILSFILFIRSNFAGLQMFKTDSVISIVDRLLLIFICGYWIATDYFNGGFPINYFVYAQTAAYLASALIAFLVLFSKTREFKFSFKLNFFAVSLKNSFPFALLIMLMALYSRTDSIMLERMLGNEGALQSGIYAQSFRLLDALTNVAYLFSVILIPLFANMIKDNQNIVKLFQLAMLLIGIPAFYLFVNTYIYNQNLMELLYSEHLEDSSIIIIFHLFSFVCIALSYITGSLLTALGNMKWLNNIALAGTVVNVILNFIIIPEYKAIGAAATSSLTQLIVLVLQFLIVLKFFSLKWNLSLSLKLLVLALVIISSSFFSSSFFDNIFISLIISVLISVLGLFFLRIIMIKDVLNILKIVKT